MKKAVRQEFDEVEPVEQVNNKKRKLEAKAKKAKKMKTEAISEEKQMSILNRIDSELKEDEDSKLKDKECFHGQSIVAEIRNFGEVDR